MRIGPLHTNILPFLPYSFEGEYVDCPVCGSGSHTVVSRIDRRLKPLRTVACEACGLFYTNPMPSDRELDRYYAAEYRADYQIAAGRPPAGHVRRKEAEAVRRADAIRRHAYPWQHRTLDLGCGSGELVRELAARGYEAVGREPGQDYSAFATSRAAGTASYRIDTGSWQDAPYGPESFDVVTAYHVLEHFRDPVGALRTIAGWLAEDGLLFVEVPDLQAYSPKCFERFHFAHVVGFSRDNLIYAAEQAGFRVVTEDGPTSLVLRKGVDGARPAIDLAATAKRNIAEYAKPLSIPAYARHHLRRSRRLADRQLWVDGFGGRPWLPKAALAVLAAGMVAIAASD